MKTIAVLFIAMAHFFAASAEVSAREVTIGYSGRTVAEKPFAWAREMTLP